MSLRWRLTLAFVVMALLTLGVSWSASSIAFNHFEERKLDSMLHEEARQAALVFSTGHPLEKDLGGPPTYTLLYRPGHTIRSLASPLPCPPPPLDLVTSRDGRPVELSCGVERLRGVVVPVPESPGARLLFLTSRAELDALSRRLWNHRFVGLVFALFFALSISTWVLRGQLHAYQEVALAVRSVSAGDLKARVQLRPAHSELNRLGKDINDMIDRLNALVVSQHRFIAYAAHELRSPLTTLMGELSLALRRQRSEAEYREAIHEALDSTQRLHALTEDLLTLARLSANEEKAEPLDLASLWSEALRHCEAAAQARGVTTKAEGDLNTTVHGRPRDLVRLLRNLLENAINHSPQGGTVHLRTHRDADQLLIDIIDEGAGIPEEERALVFEPFYRGSQARSGEGTGLGLAIAQEIAHSHGGEVTLLLSTSGGTRFQIRLPLR